MTKIEALEKTIHDLENNLTKYMWSDFNHCNCGVVAKTLLNGKTPEQCGFLKSPKRINGYASFGEYSYCMTTDLPLPLVFQTLKDAGFVWDELKDLEDLANEETCKRANILFFSMEEGRVTNIRRSEKEYVVKYLRAWVEILKEKEVLNVVPEEPVVKERIKYVSIPETLSSQAKDIILTAEITS